MFCSCANHFLFGFQVLFVPRHWWHYVESIDPVTVSINSWIELVFFFLIKVVSLLLRYTVSVYRTW